MWKEEKPEEVLSEYEKIWKKIRESINLTAKDAVPQLYEALKKEGYSAKDARDKIKKDAFNVWKVETIDKWIPEEAKKEILVLAGKKGAEVKKARSDLGTENADHQTNQDTNNPSNTNSDSIVKEDLQVVNKNIATTSTETGETSKDPEETTSSSTTTPSLQDQISDLTNIKIRLEEQLKEANDTILRLQKELDTAQQLLREERAKNAELNKQLHELERYKRLEQIRLEAQRKSLESWKVPGDRPT